MLFWGRNRTAFSTPVLVVDSLGFANRIQSANADELMEISSALASHYHRFRATIPFSAMIVTPKWVFGSQEFSTFQLNDMFVLYSRKEHRDLAFRYVVASALLYHLLLIEGFIPRGGLGFGLVLQRRNSLLGSGFIDAYQASEKRRESTRHICAIQISPAFFARIAASESACRLLSFYEESFFLNPTLLVDPEMGAFDQDRVLQLLRDAGANSEKVNATARFFEESEDYDSAKAPGSRSWQFLNRLTSGTK